jgi:uncharacterized membrane protein
MVVVHSYENGGKLMFLWNGVRQPAVYRQVAGFTRRTIFPGFFLFSIFIITVKGIFLWQ